MADIRCAVEASDVLGESPVWDDARGLLWWIDIHGHRLHRFEPESGDHRIVALPEQVGSICLRAEGWLAAATRTGFSALDAAEGRMDPIVEALDASADLRFNDGRADRRGRFWAGTVQEKRIQGGAALYRLAPDGTCAKMLGGVTVSNGIAWSPDNRLMYFADSHAREIYVFDFDLATGSIGNQRVFAHYPTEFGIPDGATVDADGSLWSAGLGGSHVLRFAPNGRLEEAIRMPVSQPTSCTFGGPGLATLYVTSATMRLTDNERSDQPQAGHLFALDVGVRGLPEPRYEG